MDRARTAIVVIAAVTGTVHCSSVEDGVMDGMADRWEPPAELPHTSWAARWAEPEQWPVMELGALQAERRASDHFEASLGGTVTTSASASDGTRYVAGIFSGAIRVGPTLVTSHGGDDVFLARVQSTGHIAWARAVGSKGKESGAKVDFEDGRVKLVAMTDGAVDCGRGPLQTWDSETFFLCTFGPDGSPIDGASFPTGRR